MPKLLTVPNQMKFQISKAQIQIKHNRSQATTQINRRKQHPRGTNTKTLPQECIKLHPQAATRTNTLIKKLFCSNYLLIVTHQESYVQARMKRVLPYDIISLLIKVGSLLFLLVLREAKHKETRRRHLMAMFLHHCALAMGLINLIISFT